VQHEVVIPAGDRDRVELDRPELPEDLEHPRRGLPRETSQARGSAAQQESDAPPQR
jgi:hypothetical protein